MVKGGRVVYKKASGRKRKARSEEEEDDEDEEYVLEEEDEGSESAYEFDASFRDLSDGESFDFIESSPNEDDDDDDYDLNEEEEDFVRSKPRRITSDGSRRRKKSRVSDSEEEAVSIPRAKGRARSRREKSRDSDYEVEDEEDDDDEDFSPDEDEEEDEEVSVVSGKTRVYKRKGNLKKKGNKRRSKVSKAQRKKKRKKTVAAPARKRRRRTARSSDDDDFTVKDRVSVERRRKKSSKVRKNTSVASKAKKSRFSFDSESLDSDFVTSDDDFIVKDSVSVEKERKKSNKVRKNTPTASRTRRKRLSVDSVALYSDFATSDDDFIVKDDVLVDNQQKKSNKLRKTAGSKPRRKRSLVDSESSDSDFEISDDDFKVTDHVVVDKQSTRRKKVQKKKTTRKRPAVVSESSDFHDEISKQEVRDLRIERISNWRQPKQIFTQMKGKEKGKQVFTEMKREEKGKEKEVDDSGKQVCGICLSEEQKGIVQGLLNCCSHYFCFACIMEWSKVESRCPVCKRRFVTITKSGRSDPGFGMRKAVIRVQKRDQVYQPAEEEIRGMLDPYESVVCMECHQGGDDNLMLLCDICDSSAHTYCVGLGREVPEGNWYCECCRSVGDGSSHSQVQDTTTDQGASSSSSFPGETDTGVTTDMRANTNSPRPLSFSGQSSRLRIDLNISPRFLSSEDHGTVSPVSGPGASTLSGRRAIHQRIRILLSNGRPRQIIAGSNVPHCAAGSDALIPEVERSRETFSASQRLNPGHSVLGTEQCQQNNTPVFRSNANLAPCMYNERSSFRHMEGAKD